MLISFLSTSNEPVYKVFNETYCEHSRKTCDPAVSFHSEIIIDVRTSRQKNISVLTIGTQTISLGFHIIALIFNISVVFHIFILCTCVQNFTTTPMKKECPDSECLFAFYGGETVYHKYLIGLQFYNVFLFFWCANFVIALGQMTLAGAFASYYWAFVKPDDMPTLPVFSALGRSLRCVWKLCKLLGLY